MTEQELKKAGRRELLEIIYEMKKTELSLRNQLKEAQDELSDRRIKLEKAGSIAEAALALQNIFDVAQAAADQYLSSLKEAEHEIIFPETELDELQRRDDIIKQAEEEAQRLLDDTRCKCDAMLVQTEEAIAVKWQEFHTRLKTVLGKYPALSKTIEAKKTK